MKSFISAKVDGRTRIVVRTPQRTYDLGYDDARIPWRIWLYRYWHFPRRMAALRKDS